MGQERAGRPNVVVVLCDQLRAFAVGCYGDPLIRTPNIDRLAGEGVRFEVATTPLPVCMAARSAVLSGQHPRVCTGGIGNVTIMANSAAGIPEYPYAGRPHMREMTLPEGLRETGYHTAAIGKWHIHSWPGDVGFDEFCIPRVHHCHSGQSYTENGGPEFVPAGWSVDYECERVGRFLAERGRGDRPFFLYYNISPPHCPMSDAPEKYLRMYDPAEVPIRGNVDLSRPLPDQEHHFKVYRWDYRYYMFHLPYTETLPPGYSLRHVIAEYYGMTTWVDDCIGRLMGGLRERGLAENTVVVFASDHGDYLGSHGLVQKGGLHEESYRIPLVVWGPGIGARVVSRQVASLVDVMPTVLELAGMKAGAHVQGQSLASIVRGEREALARTWAVTQGGEGLGLRTPEHLYALPWAPGAWTPGQRRALGAAPCAFHDLRDDPCQLRNLAGTSEAPKIARDLESALREFDRRTPWMSEVAAYAGCDPQGESRLH